MIMVTAMRRRERRRHPARLGRMGVTGALELAYLACKWEG